jgi:hypothetical protein
VQACVLGGVVLCSALAIYVTAGLALQRPDFLRIAAVSASQLRADYSVDPLDTSLQPPLDPAVIQAAAADEAALVRTVTTAPPPAGAVELPSDVPATGTPSQATDTSPQAPATRTTPARSTPVPDDSPTPDNTPTPANTATPVPKPTDTPVPPPTVTPVPTETPTPCLFAEVFDGALCRKPTNTPAPKPTATATPAPTRTPRPTRTPLIIDCVKFPSLPIDVDSSLVCTPTPTATPKKDDTTGN